MEEIIKKKKREKKQSKKLIFIQNGVNSIRNQFVLFLFEDQWGEKK